MYKDPASDVKMENTPAGHRQGSFTAAQSRQNS